MTNSTTECVDKLNGILKGELSAVETYRQALEKVQDSKIKEDLKKCHICHSSRVDTLVEKVKEFGGNPVASSGAWGAFAKLMEGGATAFGDKASVSVLEEGEDKGIADYKKLLADSNINVKAIAGELMPKQEGTHAKMRDLKHSMN
jgi:uncharacterized protein (TIGR02284 family)